jgi:uncharacterized caspase-like protein
VLAVFEPVADTDNRRTRRVGLTEAGEKKLAEAMTLRKAAERRLEGQPSICRRLSTRCDGVRGSARMQAFIGALMCGFLDGTRVRCAVTACALAFFIFPTAGAFSQEQKPLRGVALVIGQSEYEHLAPLLNPENDADAIETLLSDLGFDSVRRTDRDAETLARDLERFAQDAEDADVAVLYYSGHGIEAGGENWLVPVDADLSALDNAASSLVPVSALVEQLQATVPVVIVMLDACRDSPFPPGSLLRPSAGAEPAAVTGGGLGLSRGAASLKAGGSPRTENVGTVIAFAAEPGKVALDGTAGGNSPYAAAVLRHFDAMAGEEFGTVMRMVAEEVYLKTGGRQRPWINESLRRLLYFGEKPDALAGAEGDILRERRQLLVSIAALPSVQRARTEALADAGGVPMSVVYAMIKSLGIDPNENPDTIEDRLRAQIEQFAALRESRRAFDGADPEIVRLTALADDAEEEGALSSADRLREEAKQRVSALRETRETQIETLRQRIAEDAEVFARSAETKKLMFRHADAAKDFGEASAMVARWDEDLAAYYRDQEITALLADAELRGTTASLDAAEAAARTALQVTPTGQRSDVTTVRLRHRLGLALMLRSDRTGDPAALKEALDLQRKAKADADMLEPDERVRILIDAGRAAAQSGLTTGETGLLVEAEALFVEAAALAEQASLQVLRIEARFRTLQALHARWVAAPDAALWASMAAETVRINEALGTSEPDAFSLRYAGRVVDIAFDLASRANSQEALMQVAELGGVAADMFDADRFPLIVAELNEVRGRIAAQLAEQFGDYSYIRHAAQMQRSAVRTYAEAGALPRMRRAEWHLALTLATIGTAESDDATLVEAIGMIEQLQTHPEVRNQIDFSRAIRFQLARLGGDLAFRQRDEPGVRTGIAAMQALRGEAEDLLSATQVAAELGRLHYRLAALTDSLEDYRKSVAFMETALGQHEAWGSDVTNPVPFSNLYAVYADSTAALAFTSGEAADLSRAIDANERLSSLFGYQGNVAGMVSIANVIGNLAAQELSRGFGTDSYARAQGLLAEASSLAEPDPRQFAAVQRTRCVLELANATQQPGKAAVQKAVERCSSSLDTFHTFGPEDMVRQAEKSMRQAEALYEQVTAGQQ